MIGGTVGWVYSHIYRRQSKHGRLDMYGCVKGWPACYIHMGVCKMKHIMLVMFGYVRGISMGWICSGM